jgi:hypothetical protein
MKVEFEENNYGTFLTLIPETVEEMAGLLRAAKNTSCQKPDVYFSFSRDPNLSVSLYKRKLSAQVTSINP